MVSENFKAATGKQDLASKFANRIVAMLEQGERPWHQPWKNGNPARIMRPLRHNGQPYSGINTMMLWLSAQDHGFTNPNWMTLRQANALGAHVLKGEHATPIIFADRILKSREDENGEKKEYSVPIIKPYFVFNCQQIEGLDPKYYDPAPARLPAEQRHQNADEFFDATGADIRYGGDKAYYALNGDYIRMPDKHRFEDDDARLSTLSHEVTHWTRHPSRLARDFGRQKHGDEGYAREEIVAELGSALLCSELDLIPEPREENAAYIGHWIKMIKNDPKFIFHAAAEAQKAADYVISANVPMAPEITPDMEAEQNLEQEIEEPALQPVAAVRLPSPGF